MEEVKIYWWTELADTIPHIFLTKEARDEHLLQWIQTNFNNTEDYVKQAKAELARVVDFSAILDRWFFVGENVIHTEQPLKVEQDIYWWYETINAVPRCFIDKENRDKEVLSEIKNYNQNWYSEAFEDINKMPATVFGREDAMEICLCDLWYAGQSRIIA